MKISKLSLLLLSLPIFGSQGDEKLTGKKRAAQDNESQIIILKTNKYVHDVETAKQIMGNAFCYNWLVNNKDKKKRISHKNCYLNFNIYNKDDGFSSSISIDPIKNAFERLYYHKLCKICSPETMCYGEGQVMHTLIINKDHQLVKSFFFYINGKADRQYRPIDQNTITIPKTLRDELETLKRTTTGLEWAKDPDNSRFKYFKTIQKDGYGDETISAVESITDKSDKEVKQLIRLSLTSGYKYRENPAGNIIHDIYLDEQGKPYYPHATHYANEK
jgi:hypothetical protein